MDTPANRMSKPGRRAGNNGELIDAPPVVVLNRVQACVCPWCGKAQMPLTLRTYPEKGHAIARCTACSGNITYYYATEDYPIPRVRYYFGPVVDSTGCPPKS